MLSNSLRLATETIPSLSKPADRLEVRYTDEHSGFLELDDLRVHYRTHGDPADDTLLLVHGTYSSLHTWEWWVADLKEDYHVVRLDMPGCGLTGPRHTGEHTMAYYIDVLGTVCDELDLDDVVYAGNSLGGGLGLRLAVARPDLLSGLILLAPGGGTLLCRIVDSLATPLFAQYPLPRVVVRGIINDAYASGTSPDSATVKRYHDLVMRRGNRAAFRELARNFRDAHPEDCGERSLVPSPPSNHDTSPELCDVACARNVEVPVLFQCGEEDDWLPVSFSRELESLVRTSTFMLYEDVGHVPMEERPAQTAADARAFLRDIDW